MIKVKFAMQYKIHCSYMYCCFQDLKRPRKRLTELLVKSSQQIYEDTEKSWTLKLLRSPLNFLDNGTGQVKGVQLRINRLHQS